MGSRFPGPIRADPHRTGPAVSNSPAICKDRLHWANPPLLSFVDVLLAGRPSLVEGWLCSHMFCTSLRDQPPAFCRIAQLCCGVTEGHVSLSRAELTKRWNPSSEEGGRGAVSPGLQDVALDASTSATWPCECPCVSFPFLLAKGG